MGETSSVFIPDRPLILVIDDDRSTRLLLNLAMEEEGYRIVESKNGEQGIVEYSRCHPDMVLLDAVMPEMDGFTCCRRLRQLPGGDRTPILMITVLDDQDSVDQAFNAGATDYITKPIHWAVVSQRVQRLITASRTLQEAEEAKELLRQYQQWENFLRGITEQLCQFRDYENIVYRTISELKNLLQVEQVVVRDLDNKVVGEAMAPGYPSLEKLALPELDIFNNYAQQAQYDQIVAIEDLSEVAIAAPFEELNIKSLLIAPILVQGNVWGLLSIYKYHVTRPWQQSVLERITHLTNLLAIAVYQVEREQGTENREQEQN